MFFLLGNLEGFSDVKGSGAQKNEWQLKVECIQGSFFFFFFSGCEAQESVEGFLLPSIFSKTCTSKNW